MNDYHGIEAGTEMNRVALLVNALLAFLGDPTLAFAGLFAVALSYTASWVYWGLSDERHAFFAWGATVGATAGSYVLALINVGVNVA